MRTPFIVASVLTVAALGCARTTATAVDAGAAEDSAPAAPEPIAGASPAVGSTKPKHLSIIAGAADSFLVGTSSQVLGDIDGDGFDDFAIEAVDLSPEVGHEPASQTYLFYGRPEFPAQVSLADADAVFASYAWGPPAPLGDVNGDGLADFAILNQQPFAYEFVLGSRTRFQGARAAHTSGPQWVSPVIPQLGVPLAFTVAAAGDVNCDRVDDLLVYATRLAQSEADDAANGGRGTVENTFIVLGGKTLPEGDWDPSWAVARFDQPASDPNRGGELLPSAFGDLDADGCDDLIAFSNDTLAVFYGGESRFRGSFGPSDNDARLHGPSRPAKLHDLDGDGTDELVFALEEGGKLQVQYGSRNRWSGERTLEPELTVSLDGVRVSSGALAIDSGDVDMDGSPDLLIGVGMNAAGEDDGARPARGVLYALHGRGRRIAGTVPLTESERFFSGPEVDAVRDETPERMRGLGTSLSLAGDLDGDGARDVLSGAPSFGENGAMFLLPSSPRAPNYQSDMADP